MVGKLQETAKKNKYCERYNDNNNKNIRENPSKEINVTNSAVRAVQVCFGVS